MMRHVYDIVPRLVCEFCEVLVLSGGISYFNFISFDCFACLNNFTGLSKFRWSCTF